MIFVHNLLKISQMFFQGIARPKTSSDCFSVLLKELKQYASQNKHVLTIFSPKICSEYQRNNVFLESSS